MPETLTSPPPASTSTRATRTRRTEGRQRLRRKPDPADYYAHPSDKSEAKIIGNAVRHVRAGDLLIADVNGIVVDTVPAHALDAFYESADTPVFTLSPEQVTRCAAVLPIGATQGPEAFTKAVASRITFEGA